MHSQKKNMCGSTYFCEEFFLQAWKILKLQKEIGWLLENILRIKFTAFDVIIKNTMTGEKVTLKQSST